MGESAPFWRFSAASYPDLEETMPIDTRSVAKKETQYGDSSTVVGVILQILLLALSYLSLFVLKASVKQLCICWAFTIVLCQNLAWQ